MTHQPSVLIICQHNSGRSQIAAAYLRDLSAGKIRVDSAGMEPADKINPLVSAVMANIGIDLSGIRPQSVFKLYQNGRLYDHVITVCDSTEEQCPVFPGVTRRWHWPFPDPAAVTGNEAEKLDKVRNIRDMILHRLVNPPVGDFNYQDLL